MRGVTWKEAKEILKFEEETLAKANWDVHKAEDAMSEEDLFEYLYGLDIGVASTVAALSAARCCTISSCNAGLGHQESYPLVAFHCRPFRLLDILSVAEQVDCGLENGPEGNLVVYAESVKTLMEFARTLIARRKTLAKLTVDKVKRPTQCTIKGQPRLFE